MIIFDTSTLILLAKIQLLRQTLERFKIQIPKIVEEEAVRKDTMDAKLIRQLINEGKLIVRQNPPEKELHSIIKDFPIDTAEVAALLIAKKINATLATDDGVTIKVCKILNVRFITAIHVVIKAKEDRMINKEIALAKLEMLAKYGRYSVEIIENAIRRIRGE
jgi:predicted nucleic acid-binding protein